ncbi:phage portal protein [Streptomyces decoyicus]|uniref:phage portal protein n=1 Tax=Streptomyces decoyicus TaxID=249567 RepID=UPI002E179A61
MKVSDRSPDEWATDLSRRHDGELDELKALNAYYEGEQPLAYMHPELLAEIGDQIRQVVINWPRLIVDAIEERLDVEGFRYPDADEPSDELWRIWQANGMDGQSQQAHVDSLTMKRSFLTVGTNALDSNTPLVTAESPLQMYADFDPQTRAIRAALKRWNEMDPLTGMPLSRHGTLYLPNQTIQFDSSGPGTWKIVDVDDHGLGDPLVAVLPNKPRTLVPGGVSELRDVLPISDAANKVATDMMVSAEYHAVPRRVAFGFDEDDFTDADGKPLSVWSRISGRIWATRKNRKSGEDGDGADVIQFPEAQLTNFHSTIELLAKVTSALAGLPPNYLGLVADDAASADAIRSRETRLVKRAERKHRPLSSGYERMNQLVMRVRDGDWDPSLRQLETLWRDPATPTYAQKADAVVKLHSAGLLPAEQAWEDLGYSDVQRRRMQRMQDDQAARLTAADLSMFTTSPPQAPAEPLAPPAGP